jgi:hypothetical protein
MSKVRISQLPEASVVNAGDELAVNQSGTTRKITRAQVVAGLAASGAVTSSGLTMTSARVLGRTTASTGAVEELSLTGSGSVVLGTGPTIAGGTFTDGYTEEVATANTGTAYTIDLANGSVQILTLTENCTFTFPTATEGRGFTLLLKQDGTGSRTATWPAAVAWPGGTAPTITSTANKVDKYVFVADGTNWIGSNAGQNYTV